MDVKITAVPASCMEAPGTTQSYGFCGQVIKVEANAKIDSVVDRDVVDLYNTCVHKVNPAAKVINPTESNIVEVVMNAT